MSLGRRLLVPLLAFALIASLSFVGTASARRGDPVNLAPPAIVGSLVAGQSVTATTGNWSNNPTAYNFQWQSCSSSGSSCRSITDAQSSTYSLSSTIVGRTLRVVVTAVNSVGSTSARSSTTSLVGAASPVVSISAPTQLATTSTATSISLTWAGSTAQGTSVTGYAVYLDGAKVATVGTTSYTFSGVACGTTHSVGVAGVDGAGHASETAAVNGSTKACPDTSAPTVPTGLGTGSVSPTSATLSWTASTDNVGVTGYRLFRGGSQVGTTSGTSYAFGGLTCGAAYSLGVAAVDAAGNVSATATTGVETSGCADTSAPTAPTGLATSSVSQSSATLSWTASTDNVGVTGYRLFRGGSQVGTASGTSYVFGGLACGTSYSLGVAAVDAAGNVSGTTSANVQTGSCPDTTAPSAPAGLSTSAAGQTSVTLGWSAATDNVGVTGYRLFQNGAQVGTAFGTSYLYSGLACGTTYTLGVAAIDAAGNVSSTSSLSASTTACSSGGSGGGGTPAPGAANVYVSTSGSDTTCVRGDQTKPCLTLNRALTVASCSDSVSVAAGSYAGQSLSAAKSCSATTPVSFTTSGSVTFTGGVSVNASYVSFNGPGFTFADGYAVGQGKSYVTFANVRTSHGFIMGDHVTIQGGEIGPNNNCTSGDEDGLQIWDNGTVSASYVTVDGVTIHDISDNGNQCSGYANSGVHTDCIQMLGPNNVTIQNSVFYKCATAGIMARPYTTPLNNITIQNNMMGPVVTPGASINIGNSTDSCTNVVVRFNTAMSWPSIICGAGGSGNVVTGNIFDGYYAQAGFTSAANVTENTAATGTGSKKCVPTFASPSTTVADYHLAAADTCAKNAASASNVPATDVDKQGRPMGAAPDMGADEAG